MTSTKIFLKNDRSLKIFYLIVLAFISYLPFLLAQGSDHLIISVFNGFEHQTFDEFLSTWHKAYLGRYTTLFVPNLIVAYFLFKVIPPILATTIYMGSIKFIAGVGIFVFLGHYTKRTSVKVLGSLFYILSVYGQAVIGTTPAGGYLFYALLPIIVYLFVTINKANVLRNTLFFVVGIYSLSDTNFTYIAYLFLFLFLCSIYFLIIKRDVFKLGIFFVFGILLFFINAYYYLPLFAYNNLYSADIISMNLLAESAGWKGSYSSVAEVLRLMGSLDFYNKVTINNQLILSRPFFLYFTSFPHIIILSYIFPLFAIIGLSMSFAVKKKDVLTYQGQHIFYLICFLIFLFFSIGAHPASPLSFVYNYLYENFLPFAIFRDPYKSVSILNLLYTIGIVFFFNKFFHKKKLYYLVVSIFLGALGITSVPFLKGDIYSQSEVIKIPSYVNDFANWNSNSSVFREKKLLLPHQPFPVFSYSTYPGKGGPLFFQLLNSTGVQGDAQYTGYIDQIQRLALDESFEKILGFYDIPIVLNIKDLNHTLYKSEDPKALAQAHRKTLTLLKSFGQDNNIEVFSIDKRNHNNVVYIPSRVIGASGSALQEGRSDLKAVFSNQHDNLFMFVDQKIFDMYDFEKFTQSPPNATVVPKSNFEYELKLENISGNFIIIFNESYNRGWVLKGLHNVFKEVPVIHIPANGFSNAYLIKKEDLRTYFRNGDIHEDSNGNLSVSLRLYFQPQLFLYAGIIISSVTFLSILGYFLIKKRKITKQ